MQSPFCILTSYHGKFRNLGNLYISTFSTSTWLYCPSWIHPVSSTSAFSFLREKFLTSDHKIVPMEIQGHSHICQLDKLAEIFLGFINIDHFQSTNEEMKCFINGVKRRSTRLVRFSSQNYDWSCLNRTWIIIHEPEEISVICQHSVSAHTRGWSCVFDFTTTASKQVYNIPKIINIEV